MNLLGAVGMAKPVSEFINTAGQYQQTQSGIETQAMQRKLFEAKIAEQERRSRPVLLSELVGRGSDKGKPNMMKVFADAAKPFAKKIQIPGGGEDYAITQDDLPQVHKFMELQKDMHGPLQWATYQDNQLVIQNAEKERAKLKTGAEQVAFDENIENIKTQNASILKEFGKEGEEGKPYTLGENQKRFGADNKEVASGPVKEEEKWSDPTPMVIDGKTVMTQKSSKTGQIKTVAQGSTTNVNVDVDMGLSKGARAKAEEDVQESTDMYKGLENLVSISKPEFFTYKGQIQAGAERIGEKAGIVNDPKFLKDYSSWKVGTEQEFNKYRKWATGVAAGEKELERLAGSFPNVNMSKTQYMAAAKQTAVNAWKLAERRRRALNAGINDPGKQKEFYRLLPLDSMPDPPPEVVQRFSPKSKFEIIGVE